MTISNNGKIYADKDIFFENECIVSTPAGQGATRKVLAHNENLMLVEVTFEKDADGAPHSHPHEQSSMVVSGKILFRMGEKEDEQRVMLPGDSVYIPSGHPHCLRALEPSVVLDVFTPMREDFIK